MQKYNKGPRLCASCASPVKGRGRTCGRLECIAYVLHTDGLLEEPTVTCLNKWRKRSLIRQMVEADEKSLHELVRLYATLI